MSVTLSDIPEMDIKLRPSYYRDNLFTEYYCSVRDCPERCQMQVYLADRPRVHTSCKLDRKRVVSFTTRSRGGVKHG